MATIIGLTGKSGCGKSTLAAALQKILGDLVLVVSTSSLLRERFPQAQTAEELRRLGNELDISEPGWFIKGNIEGKRVVVVDAIRSFNQVIQLRSRGRGFMVRVGDLDPLNGATPFDHSVPKHVDPDIQAISVLEAAGLSLGADAVIGAQWGSEGKGKVAAYLARTNAGAYSAMGRAGGPNAGHRVELPDGSYKVFRHLPSATPYAEPGTLICLGPGAVIDLDVLKSELPFIPQGCTLVVDPAAAVVSDTSRALEKQFKLDEIGSTMTGTGGAMAERVLRTGTTFGQLSEIGEIKVAPVGPLLRAAAIRGRILLESTQGMQLSLFHGKYPHVTSRDVSPAMLLAEMGLPAEFPTSWYVVARTYPIRVAGPSGDLPNESDWEQVAATSGREVESLKMAERTSVTNRLRRVARWKPGFLFETVQRAFSHPHRVTIVITFADYLKNDPTSYNAILDEAKLCGASVLIGDGPGTLDMHRLC